MLSKIFLAITNSSISGNSKSIAFGTFNFFDLFEHRNRWWGCEIRYDGDGNLETLKAMDRIFGLTNNKQEVTKFYYEDSVLAEDLYGEDEYEDRKKRDLSLQMRINLSKAFKDIHTDNFNIIRRIF